MIISAFPGTGKSYAKFNHTTEYEIYDLESAYFSRAKTWPENYLEYVSLYEQNENSITFVSTHDTIRRALIKNNMKYTLILPHLMCKQEYINRYVKRGNVDNFIYRLDKNFETWISDSVVFALSNPKHINLYFLYQNEYINDKLNDIISTHKQHFKE